MHAIPESLAQVAFIFRPEENLYAAGQPMPEQFADFAEQGVKHVLNMRPDEEMGGFDEAATVTAAGMSYSVIPVAGPGDLSRENVEKLDQWLANAGAEPALVHCASSNRVGALIALRAAWLNGSDEQSAIEQGQAWGLTRMEPMVRALIANG